MIVLRLLGYLAVGAAVTIAPGMLGNLEGVPFGVTSATAQRAPVEGQWELLGEAEVAFRGDSDLIEVARDEGFYRTKSYRRLRLVIAGGDVRLRNVKVVYLNGHVENFAVNRSLSEGAEFLIDLKGERSYLKTIVLDHKGKFNLSFGPRGLRLGKPTVRVFGENVRFFVPPPLPPPAAETPRRWEPLAEQRFDRRTDKIVMSVGRREGRYGQIKLRADGEPVFVRQIAVRFGNGDVQEFALDRRMRDGEETATLDLQGERRFIEQVAVILEPRTRPGAARLTLLGLDRPGNEGPRAEAPGRRRDTWIPLGRQSVSPGVDRDTIEVATPADGPRAKTFDKLHFIAETNDVLIRAITVVYLNGITEDLTADRRIPAGGELTLDLPGRRSYLRRIELVYSARPGSDRPAIVSVFGERVGRDF